MPRQARKSVKRKAADGPVRRRRASPKITEMIRAHRQKVAIGIRYFQAANELMDQLVEKLQPGVAISIGGGLEAELVDLFADANKIFKPQAVPRYEIVVRDADGSVVRLRDRRQARPRKKTAKKKPAKKKAKKKAATRPRLKVVRP